MSVAELEIEYSKPVEDLIDIFDFFTVHKVMHYIGHEYAKSLEVAPSTGDVELKTEPPTIDHLKDLAREILQCAYDKGEGSEVESGGFRAEKFKDTLRLTFCLSQLETTETGEVVA